VAETASTAVQSLQVSYTRAAQSVSVSMGGRYQRLHNLSLSAARAAREAGMHVTIVCKSAAHKAIIAGAAAITAAKTLTLSDDEDDDDDTPQPVALTRHRQKPFVTAFV